eukprot:TRINITY_DN14673_c0_g1_i1.p1 TRINITY_DN14673_c0_g1~~TRINITY_DN14673_c0_g1_i1.p1  ORF type:complete len:136 (-),score=23.66 TRINITY_DN14673_c0_g1_i1:144-551(-)
MDDSTTSTVNDRSTILNSSLQVEPESDIDDLENNLRALERLDRSSPDLWPEQIPGVNQFIPNTPSTNTSSPGFGGELMHELGKEDMELLVQLGTLSLPSILAEVKKLQNLAYQLGQEESKEMTRGKYLNILRRRN